MIRTIADVALRKYDRWYVLAHSQGSVVAFNGLMEPAFGWPAYIDERRWNRLRTQGFAGLAAVEPPAMRTAVPARPLWVPEREIAYRSRIFANFGGLLTYGCPLEKFAAIWPARVPVCREKAFGLTARWLNVYDPLDPVSGVMRSWPDHDPEYCPAPRTIGYASSSVLLLGHVKYMECPIPAKGLQNALGSEQRLADGVAQWLLDDDISGIVEPTGSRFFQPGSARAWCRSAAAWAQWFIAFATVTLLGAWAIPPVFGPVIRFSVKSLGIDFGQFEVPSYWSRVAGLALGSGIVTFVAGAVALIFTGGARHIEEQLDVRFSGVVSPEPLRGESAIDPLLRDRENWIQASGTACRSPERASPHGCARNDEMRSVNGRRTTE